MKTTGTGGACRGGQLRGLGICMWCVLLMLASAVSGAASEEVMLGAPADTIYGTLEVPEARGPVPVALIISGSGPTDRDGNTAFIGRNDSLKMLAEGLAARGIASLRYDKRGVAASAASAPGEEGLRFETYIEDAGRWGRLLRQDRRFGRLIIIGHSEGSLIGVVAAGRLGADGFVSIAGPGRPAGDLIDAQMARMAPPDVLSEVRTITALLRKGETTGNVPPSLMALFRPSVQPYLISWFRYDPAKEVSRFTGPVLIIQGATDQQVSVTEARLLLEANKGARMVVVEGMNHVLKNVPPDIESQKKSYSDPSLPVSPVLIDSIAAFIKKPIRGAVN